MRHLLLKCLVVGALFLGMLGGAAHAEDFGAGFLDLQLTDPVEGGPMPAIVFYPTKSDGGSTQVGPFTIAATRGAAPAAGSYPLIVHSHGTGGSHLGHHDTLAALARAGFVAAAVEHPRDNYRDNSGFATDLQLIGRPHHIVALIDGVLAHATVGPLVDRARIGMAGFSAGGYTALLIAGAVPDFSLQAEPTGGRCPTTRCASGPTQPTSGAASPISKIVCRPAREGHIPDGPGARLRLRPAPAWPRSRCPCGSIGRRRTRSSPTPGTPSASPRCCPSRPSISLIEGAGHYVFLPPCPTLLALRIPAICKDPRASTAPPSIPASTPR